MCAGAPRRACDGSARHRRPPAPRYKPGGARVMIFVVPYRSTTQPERAQQLREFLDQVAARVPCSRVVVAEQCDERRFNRGKLFNAAVRHGLGAGWLAEADTVCLHDVDMVPSAELLAAYTPSLAPGVARHIGCTARHRSLGNAYLGGILMITAADYLRVNGHSNEFWGWGGEDVDFRRRLLRHGMQIERVRGHVTDLERFGTHREKAEHNRASHKAGRSRCRKGLGSDGVIDVQFSVENVEQTARTLHLWICLH